MNTYYVVRPVGQSLWARADSLARRGCSRSASSTDYKYTHVGLWSRTPRNDIYKYVGLGQFELSDRGRQPFGQLCHVFDGHAR